VKKAPNTRSSIVWHFILFFFCEFTSQWIHLFHCYYCLWIIRKFRCSLAHYGL